MDKTVDQLYTDVVGVIKDATGLELVIRGDENASQPRGDYASILLMTEEQQGLSAVVYGGNTFTFGFEGGAGLPFDSAPFQDTEEETDVGTVVSATVYYVFSLQIYRTSSPMDLMRRVKRYSQTPWGSEKLGTLAISLVSVSDGTQTNYEVGKKWIKRASAQLVFGASSEDYRVINGVEEIDLIINNEETVNIK
jgi:hypothetical protein